MMMRTITCGLFLTLIIAASAQSQQVNYEIGTVGFYNLENLFDTLDTPDKRDHEFTPEGRNRWNSEKYLFKLDQLSKVIKDIGTSIHPAGLAVLAVSEVENRDVLEDLVAHPELKDRNYQIVFEEGPDRRGIDVGLLYNPQFFEVESWKSYRLSMADTSFRTRDQLLVTGKLSGERIHMIVAHWPSRSGGQKRSEPKRIAAAELGRHIVDSLMTAEDDAAILYLGDLNDDPVNKSLTRVMKATGDRSFARGDRLFNPMEDLYQKGIGSLAWRDTWNLFDQILLSPGLMEEKQGKWTYHTARVYNKPYLLQTSGSYKGYPLRTFAGGAWTKGYSDHFPVYVILKRPIDPLLIDQE
ncbi:MAG: endonuclease/exonuclease/phosphatase family protein [Flavobacteriales bacterium]|nr:endonuclease/exonuclease/phosphatase family protein [Flavobacteriales bacterium]